MYRIFYDKRVYKDIKNIPPSIIKNIFKKIEGLAKNPKRKGVKKLIGIDGYRLQVGKYRILFTIEEKEKIIKVFKIKHRKDVYR
jgi:mRNA interferase RelE/StbE